MKTATRILLIGTVVVWAVYDVLAIRLGGVEATISYQIQWVTNQWWGASIVFAFGYLCGHLFAQSRPVERL